MREGLRLVREQDRLREIRLNELRAEIQKGIDSLERGEGRRYDSAAELFEELKAERRSIDGKRQRRFAARRDFDFAFLLQRDFVVAALDLKRIFERTPDQSDIIQVEIHFILRVALEQQSAAWPRTARIINAQKPVPVDIFVGVVAGNGDAFNPQIGVDAIHAQIIARSCWRLVVRIRPRAEKGVVEPHPNRFPLRRSAPAGTDFLAAISGIGAHVNAAVTFLRVDDFNVNGGPFAAQKVRISDLEFESPRLTHRRLSRPFGRPRGRAFAVYLMNARHDRRAVESQTALDRRILREVHADSFLARSFGPVN